MNKNLKNTLIAISAIMMSAVVFLGGYLVGRSAFDKDIETVNYILGMYKKYYYEETNDLVGVIENALLDKYSEYYTKEEYDVVKKTSLGKRSGVGLSFYSNSNKIMRAVNNSPAGFAGIKPNGVLVAIDYNGKRTTIDTTEERNKAFSAIPDDTEFSLIIDYDGVRQSYAVKKEEYTETFVTYYDETGEYGFTGKSGSISYARTGDNQEYPLGGKNKTGVIKYTGFSGLGRGNEGSAGQFKKALDTFKENGKTVLILDLRNNGGGYMNILESVSAHLIDAEKASKQLVSYAIYKDKKKSSFYSEAVDYSDYNYEKIIILANENSASASEALMGAVLDYDKNSIVTVIVEKSYREGKPVYKTYGKGIMQSTYTRITGEAIKLTTAKIYWPKTGISIHDIGINPDLDERIIGSDNAFYDALSLSR